MNNAQLVVKLRKEIDGLRKELKHYQDKAHLGYLLRVECEELGHAVNHFTEVILAIDEDMKGLNDERRRQDGVSTVEEFDFDTTECRSSRHNRNGS